MQASDSAESGTGPYLTYRMLTTIKSTTRQINPNLELSKQVQRLVMVDFPRALPTQTLTWS